MVDDRRNGPRLLVCELSESGFRGTAGGEFLRFIFAFEFMESAPSKVRCRGGGGGGTGLRPAAASGAFSVALGLGTQSGSGSEANGFDFRWTLATRPSRGGLIVAFTGAPVA